MRTLALIGLLTTGLSACVVYEKGHDHDGDYGHEDSGMSGLADGGEAGGGTEQAPAVSMAFYPDQAEQGEVFIGYLSVREGELDLTQVQGLSFYGDVELLTYDLRSSEVIVTLAVDDQAASGPVDLLVDMGGNDVVWKEAAFTIYASDSGHSSGDAPADDTGTGGGHGGDTGADSGCD